MKSLSYSLVAIGLVLSSSAALAQTTAYERQLDHRNRNEWVAPAPKTPKVPRKLNQIELSTRGTQLVEFLYSIGASHIDEITTSHGEIEITANFPLWHTVTPRNGALLVHTKAKVTATGQGDQQSFKYEQPELIYTTTKPEQNLSLSDALIFVSENNIAPPKTELFEEELRNIQGALLLYFRSNALSQP